MDRKTKFPELKKVLFVILFFCFVFQNLAQLPDTVIRQDVSDITDKIENMANSTDEVSDYSDLIQDLRHFSENPLNLNYASTSDLERLFFLSDMQIYNLIAHRETYGLFLTLYELQSIKGFDPETIQKILPYVMVSEEKPLFDFKLKDILKYGRHETILRYQRVVQEQKGYLPISDSALFYSPNSRYLGSPDKIYLKYNFRFHDRIRLSFLAEKDAGEVFIQEKVNDSLQKLIGDKLKNGFDFYSFNFSLSNFGKIKAFTLGDYQISFGQGLTLSSGLAFGKSSEAVDIKRTSRGISPTVSANENLFFRGGALTLETHQFDLTMFYSGHSVDASIAGNDNLTSETAYISSMQESGLHRTPGEIIKKKAVNIRACGAHLSWRQNKLKIGLTGYYTQLGIPLYIENKPYRKFEFEGNSNFNAGFDYNYLLKKINIFGEIAYSVNGAFAQLHGFNANLHPSLTLSLLYRKYDKNYRNFFSNSFAEGSHIQNEQGFYTGLRLQLTGKWVITGYFDQFRFPWLRYRVDAPSRGNETMMRIQKTLNREVMFYVSFRQTNKQLNQPTGESITLSLVNTRKNSYRFHIEYNITQSIILKNRFEYTLYQEGADYKGNGYIVMQDVTWRSAGDKFSLAGRYALTETDSWDERIYAYENDVLYAFSVPAYYYNGSRFYLLFGFRVSPVTTISFRIANTSMTNRTTIGSGLDEINGNNKTEIKVQLRVVL